MNERLKELIEKAGISRSGLWLADDNELERFAEMIRADERKACLNCYSPDDTAQDWIEKIKARSEPNPAFKNYMGDNWAGIV